jgi:hypothetical protein
VKTYQEFKQVDYPHIGESVLQYWKENQIFEKSISNREGAKTFTFYEGPPSANGTPGIHHVMARTLKDIFCRYKTLRGFQVKRKGGWDTHGLPVELGVEKELGITKEDIGKKISVAEYNQKCREAVLRYKDKWDDITKKMGYWVDLQNPYVTFARIAQLFAGNLNKLYAPGIHAQAAVDASATVPPSCHIGPFVQIGDTEGEEKPRYASLRTGQMMESISLEDALELFKLPKTLGQFEDKDMVVAIGKFGPYVRHDGAFYSIPKEFDPHTLEEAKAIEIIQEKRQKDIDKLIKVFDENPDARIENGRWGPYIKFGKLNIKIPKDKTPESISYAEVLVLAEAAEKEPKKGGAKRFAKKK